EDLGGSGGGALVLEHVGHVAANEHRLIRLRELDAAEPRAAQQRADPAGVSEREGSRRPGLLAEAEQRRGPGDLEPGVSDASRGGEPACLGHLDPGEVRAESMPAAGGPRREDGHLTAAAPDVENVLPVADLRGDEQPRPQRAQHPLMPFTLLDELSPACAVPVLGLLHVHRHERHATSDRSRCPARGNAARGGPARTAQDPRLYGGPMASVKQFQVTFDCAEPERVARFWCEVLGYVVPPPPEGFATW